jgi:hypothetical protein
MRIYKDGETITLSKTGIIMDIRDHKGIQGQKRHVYRDPYGNGWVEWYGRFYQFDMEDGCKIRRDTEACKVY